MTTEQEKLIGDRIKESLEKSRVQGISIGAKSVSKVIYDKVSKSNRESSKNDLLRVIKEVRSFCETGLAINPEESK